MRYRLIAQETVRRPHAELGGIKHHENFRRDRFGRRLACFAANELRDFLRAIAQQALKSPYNLDTLRDWRSLPLRLRRPRAQYCGLHLFGARARQFGEHLSR